MDTAILKELGLEKAAEKVDKANELKRKMAIAYEHYRFVSPDVLNRFQKQLHDKTKKIKDPCPRCRGKAEVKLPSSSLFKKTIMDTCGYCQGTGAREMTYDTLSLMPLKDYPEVPPAESLDDLKVAQERGCFDAFEVAKVETVVSRPDPIIFGLINGCVDRFYITQWDNDVKIEDILKENEG